jgi:hypothetical protein
MRDDNGFTSADITGQASHLTQALRRLWSRHRLADVAQQGCVAAALTLPLASAVVAAPFPPVFPLASLLPGSGGDGSQGIVFNGANQNDQTGSSVASAGDVNGDGLNDIIIGVRYSDPLGRTNAGVSYVVFGTSDPFPASFELTNLRPDHGGDGSKGFVILGNRTDDRSGAAVSSAGDVNGDRIGDLVVGAFSADVNGLRDAGQAVVVFGRDSAVVGSFPALLDIRSLLPQSGGDGSVGFVVNAMNDFDGVGVSLAGPVDFNADGVGDLLIGSSKRNGDLLGRTFVLFGSDTQQNGSFPAVFQLGRLLPENGGDGSLGVVLETAQNFEESATALSAADLNADGVDDIVIGAPGADVRARVNCGGVMIAFGRDTAQVGNFPPVLDLTTLLPAAGGDGTTGFVLSGIHGTDLHIIGDSAGSDVSRTGDVNGDGISDVIIAADKAPVGGLREAGQAYVLFGKNAAEDGNFPALSSLARLLPVGGGDGSAGFVLSGIHEYDQVGTVSNAGDINGDGIADIVVGSGVANQAYVIFGRAASGFTPSFPLARLLPAAGGNGEQGFVMQGAHPGDSAGLAVSSAGDFNGDGIGDLLVAAPGGAEGVGQVYLVFGRANAP